MRQKTTTSLLIVFIILVVLVFSSCTGNWPQFRGPEANMVSQSVSLPEAWANNKNVQWTFEINGQGNSSPIVWGDKVFITAAWSDKKEAMPEPQMGPPPGGAGQNPATNGAGQSPSQRRTGQGNPPAAPGVPVNRPPEDFSYMNSTYTLEVTCLDLKTGRELWEQVAYKGKPRIKKQPMNTYANETPVTDGKRLYAYFGMAGVYCYDLNGTLLWQKDLGTFETAGGWGTGSSPVVYREMLYVQVDNDTTSFITALDAATGAEKWKVARDEKTNYSTPVIWKNKVRTELVTLGKKARSYDPATGKVLWELKTGGENIIPSPVADKEHIYLGTPGGRDKPGYFFSVKAGASGDITPKEGETSGSGVEWKLQDAGMGNPSPLLYKGMIYLLAGRGGELNVLDAATGKNIYKQKIEKVGGCWASPWACNDKIFFYDEKGGTHILKAGAVFKELSQNQLDDKFWASVAITRDAYIFRGAKKLFCVKEAGK